MYQNEGENLICCMFIFIFFYNFYFYILIHIHMKIFTHCNLFGRCLIILNTTTIKIHMREQIRKGFIAHFGNKHFNWNSNYASNYITKTFLNQRNFYDIFKYFIIKKCANFWFLLSSSLAKDKDSKYWSSNCMSRR